MRNIRSIAALALSLFLFCGLFLPECACAAADSDAEEAPSGKAVFTGYDDLLKNYTNTLIDSDDNGYGAIRITEENETPNRYIYEIPTVKAFSHMFWAVNLYKLEDDVTVDEFMAINECPIYKNFHSDELEWREIRDATRKFIADNKEDFPTRFEFVIPLKLLDYDQKRKAFEVQEPYKIRSLRRFELAATDYGVVSCSQNTDRNADYPRVLILEFSRPFNLVYVPSDEEQAFSYIRDKMELLRRRYDDRHRNKKTMYNLRDAFLVIKVKIFAHGKILGTNARRLQTVQMMGVLEGYEIYEDQGKERLFYAQNYVASQSKGKLDTHLKAQYDLLRRKHESTGILH